MTVRPELSTDHTALAPVASPLTKIERLAALEKSARILAQHGDPETRFVAQALAGWLAEGAREPLEKSLGVSTHGGIGLHHAMRKAERDDMLCQLMNNHPAWAGQEPRLVARQMLQAFARYESGRWLRDRREGTAPVSEPYSTFWRLLKAEMQMPKIQRLSQILARVIQDPV